MSSTKSMKAWTSRLLLWGNRHTPVGWTGVQKSHKQSSEDSFSSSDSDTFIKRGQVFGFVCVSEDQRTRFCCCRLFVHAPSIRRSPCPPPRSLRRVLDAVTLYERGGGVCGPRRPGSPLICSAPSLLVPFTALQLQLQPPNFSLQVFDGRLVGLTQLRGRPDLIMRLLWPPSIGGGGAAPLTCRAPLNRLFCCCSSWISFCLSSLSACRRPRSRLHAWRSEVSRSSSALRDSS